MGYLLRLRAARLPQVAVLQSGADKGFKQRVRFKRPGLEFRVELTA